MRTARGSMMTLLGAGLVLALSTVCAAMDHSAMGHDATAKAAGPQGVMIRGAAVDGYGVMYHLLSWKERNEAMKGMEGMEMAGMDNSGKATNHLMFYVSGPDGKSVDGAKVGFQLTGPDGAVQKTLTMAMGGGYGADVNLKAKGVYPIKTKFVDGAKTVFDTFTHEVK